MSDTNYNLLQMSTLKDFKTRIKILPEKTQHAFIDFLSEDNYARFEHNPLFNCIMESINKLRLTDTVDEFKKVIVVEGLKILFDNLNTAYTNTGISDRIIGSHILTQYFQIIYSLIIEMDAHAIKDILLNDFEQYFNVLKIKNYDGFKKTTATYLTNNVFDSHSVELSFVEIIKETRTGNFENCTGTIVLFVNGLEHDNSHLLIFDILNKQIFMKKYAYHYRTNAFDTNITLDNLNLVLGSCIKTLIHDHTEEKSKCSCLNSNCENVLICCWNVCGVLGCVLRVVGIF